MPGFLGFLLPKPTSDPPSRPVWLCVPHPLSLPSSRQVTVDVPDQKGRLEILKVHARNKKLDAELDLQEVALRTPGFSGADLANLLNEAAILAGRKSLPAIRNQEIDEAVDRWGSAF